jgi:hypothetical protein
MKSLPPRANPPSSEPPVEPSPGAEQQLADRQLEAWLLASRQLQDAPEALIQRVIARGPAAAGAATQPPVASGLAQRLRVIVATLVHDLGPRPALAQGLRNGGQGPRRVLCRADDCDIDLHISPAPPGHSGWMLHGQVLGEGVDGVDADSDIGPATQVRLSGPGPLAQTTLNATAEFRFGPLPDGRWTLSVHSRQRVIELPALDLPPLGALNTSSTG